MGYRFDQNLDMKEQLDSFIFVIETRDAKLLDICQAVSFKFTLLHVHFSDNK